MFINLYNHYIVQITDIAEKHFIKNFEKKYKSQWDITRETIIQMVSRIDSLVGKTDKAEIISISGEEKIVKLYFKIAKTNESAKSSGNRAIILVNEKEKICLVLLVYSKNDFSEPNETQKWKSFLKENYSDIKKIFPGL